MQRLRRAMMVLIICCVVSTALLHILWNVYKDNNTIISLDIIAKRSRSIQMTALSNIQSKIQSKALPRSIYKSNLKQDTFRNNSQKTLQHTQLKSKSQVYVMTKIQTMSNSTKLQVSTKVKGERHIYPFIKEKKVTSWSSKYPIIERASPIKLQGNAVSGTTMIHGKTNSNLTSSNPKQPKILPEVRNVTSNQSNGLANRQSINNAETQTMAPCSGVNYTTFQTHHYCLQEDTRIYHKKTAMLDCLLEGTRHIPTAGYFCVCKPNWFGHSCNMPAIVEYSDYPTHHGLRLLDKPVRVIYAFPFLHEFELLEARMYHLFDVVDVFIILESNYSASGVPKQRYLLNKLQNGYLRSYQRKIFYIGQGYFPAEAKKNGWIMDKLLRNDIWTYGISRLENVRDDDVFVLTDADELPVRESFVFLKAHLGYPEPIGFNLRHNVFGFNWLATNPTSHVFGACTFAMLKHVFNNEPYWLRSATRYMQQQKVQVDDYKYHHRGRIHGWSFGSSVLPTGWHCSWCGKPEIIKLKLLSAHFGDFPRWGSYPNKTSLDYIQNIKHRGIWFDNKTNLTKADPDYQWYAPKFLKHNWNKYEYILTADKRTYNNHTS